MLISGLSKHWFDGLLSLFPAVSLLMVYMEHKYKWFHLIFKTYLCISNVIITVISYEGNFCIAEKGCLYLCSLTAYAKV